MSQFVFANNVNTTLAAGINSTATTITLTSSAHLPTLAAGEIFALTLNDAATQSVFEIVYVTAISGATLTVIRGQENTAAQSWLTNDYAYASNTAGILGSFIQSGSEPGSGFVTLSPPTQQTGNIDVSGTLNLGSGNASVAGDGGFGRSASSGAIYLGGATSQAAIDYGVTSSGIVTVSKPFTSLGVILGTPTGQTVSAPVAPCYTEAGAAQPGTFHEVTGYINIGYNTSGFQFNSVITLSGPAAFTSNTSYQVSIYAVSQTGSVVTSAGPAVWAMGSINSSGSQFTAYITTSNQSPPNTSGTATFAFTAKGY